jgi:hypothetical protein
MAFYRGPLEVKPQSSSREARRWRQRVVLMFDRSPGDGHPHLTIVRLSWDLNCIDFD